MTNCIIDSTEFTREALLLEQERDPSVAPLKQTAATIEDMRNVAEGFFFQNGVLMRKWRPHDLPAGELWMAVAQVVLPESFRKEVLRLVHEVSMAGHLGIRKLRDNSQPFILA